MAPTIPDAPSPMPEGEGLQRLTTDEALALGAMIGIIGCALGMGIVVMLLL